MLNNLIQDFSRSRRQRETGFVTDVDETHSTGGARLGGPRLMQLLRGRLGMPSGPFAPLFVSSEVGGGDIRLPRRVQRDGGYTDGDRDTKHLGINCHSPQSMRR